MAVAKTEISVRFCEVVEDGLRFLRQWSRCRTVRAVQLPAGREVPETGETSRSCRRERGRFSRGEDPGECVELGVVERVPDQRHGPDVVHHRNAIGEGDPVVVQDQLAQAGRRAQVGQALRVEIGIGDREGLQAVLAPEQGDLVRG